MGPAAERWAQDLRSWAIPQEILDAAPESPWFLPVELFARRADAQTEPTPSNLRALEALPKGGAVLDVGCGAGAGSLPLAARAGRLVGVDASADMLAAFRERAARTGAEVLTVPGEWPAVAGRVPIVDVVVNHHVVYNVGDIEPFVLALTDHARRRVVVEMMPDHPVSDMNPLWLRFHGLERPTRPTSDDFLTVLRELGIRPSEERWTSPWQGGFGRREDLVAWTRRRLCLTPDRDEEVWEAIRDRVVVRGGAYGFPARREVTVWWEGSAPEA